MQGYTYFFIFAPKHRLWVPTIYVLGKNKKNISIFVMKFSIFTDEKNLYATWASFRNVGHILPSVVMVVTDKRVSIQYWLAVQPILIRKKLWLE